MGKKEFENRIVVDISKTIHSGTPLVFGGLKFPNRGHCTDIVPKLKEVGVTIMRLDMRPESILPENITLEDYKNNVNNVQDPENWNWEYMYHINESKKYDIKVLGVMCYGGPGWLTCNGKPMGVPKDWEVYEDIIKKIYSRYQTKLDYVEVVNEPHNFTLIEGTEYIDKNSAAKEINYHFIRAIRSVSSEVKICAAADDIWEYPEFGCTRSILADPRLGPNDINVVTMHDYEFGGIYKTGELKKMMEECGRGNLPIIMGEWNCDPSYMSTDDRLYTVKAISYCGRKFIEFYKYGWSGANYFSFYIRGAKITDYADYYEEESCVLAFYTWDDETKKGELLPQSKSWRLASRSLGLGAGDSKIKLTEVKGEIHGLGAVNSAGEIVAMMANENDKEIVTEICFENIDISGSANVEVYMASGLDSAILPVVTLSVKPQENRFAFEIKLPPYSFTGVRLVEK